MKPLAPILVPLLLLGLACEDAPQTRQRMSLREDPPGVLTEEFVFHYSRTLDTDSGRLVFEYNPVSKTTLRTRFIGDSIAARDLFIFRAETVDGVLYFHTYRVRTPDFPRTAQ